MALDGNITEYRVACEVEPSLSAKTHGAASGNERWATN